jgi:hypothetical protein
VEYLASDARCDRASCNEDERFFPIYKWSKGGHLEIVRFLVEVGFDPTRRAYNNEPYAPIYVAVRTGRGDVVGYLLELEAYAEVPHRPELLEALAEAAASQKQLTVALILSKVHLDTLIKSCSSLERTHLLFCAIALNDEKLV